ncbi:MAG TPA: TetR/AcrR family transcriptional regulator [Ktedonobacterales bacterium]|jgi:AcrR family transcriptional regulator
MDVHDRRVKRTQALLARALIALTLERGYAAVTIRDITERADIGYATFFRHYHDKDALLEKVSDVVVSDLMDLLKRPVRDLDPAAVGTLLFQYARDHSEICRALLSGRGSVALVQRIVAAGAQSVVSDRVARADALVPGDVAANHLVASSVALIWWWLERDMPYPPERMGEIYRELIVRPTEALAFDA